MTLIGELAIGKGLDALVGLLRGGARRLWNTGPIGRVLVLMHHDFGTDTQLGRDVFYAWQQDEVIAETLDDLITGRLLAGPEAQARLTAALEPRLIRTPEDERRELADRMAQGVQQAVPVVLEGSQVTVLIANRLDEHMARVEAQLGGLQQGMGLLLSAHGLNDGRDDDLSAEPPADHGNAPIPVPPQAGAELPAIAEALLRGPLERSGQREAARAANDLLGQGNVDEAAAAMHAVAKALETGKSNEAIGQAMQPGRERMLSGAIHALAQVQSLESPVPLEALMSHPSAQVRLTALRAWGARSGEAQRLEALPDLAADPDVSVRLTLVALSASAPDGEQMLARLTEDPDAYVREMARAVGH